MVIIKAGSGQGDTDSEFQLDKRSKFWCFSRQHMWIKTRYEMINPCHRALKIAQQPQLKSEVGPGPMKEISGSLLECVIQGD